MRPIVLVIGTRPEGIKMIPVYQALKKAKLPVFLCSTTQHKQLLQQVYQLFNITPDIELNIMKPQQDLFYLTQEILGAMKIVLNDVNPWLVLVQGDTTTAMAAALAAFYSKISVGHIEAGLRSYVMDNPFPEEFNRRAISLIAHYHFVPTFYAGAHLIAEKVDRSRVFYTGNTVVDALRIIRQQIQEGFVSVSENIQKIIHECSERRQKLVLFTTHRRESFGSGTLDILRALKQCAQMRSDVLFFYPAHPNPYVQSAVDQLELKKISNIHIVEPLAYQDMVYVLMHSYFVATDSGGLCEEAVSIGKTVLIMRNETERMEAVWARRAILVGTETNAIVNSMIMLLDSSFSKKNQEHIFGTGYASEAIVDIIQQISSHGPVVFSYKNGKTITSV